MKITYTAKNYNISDKFKDIIEKKLSKLERYFDEDVAVKINCIEQAKSNKLEITINSKGMFFKSEVISDNMYNNIDLALPKIEKQIIKQGRKFKSKLKKDAFEINDAVYADIEEEIDPRLVKVKQIDLFPLSVEEAQSYMEALGHTFYIFLNAETNKVNVVYKRLDQDYGLIEVNY